MDSDDKDLYRTLGRIEEKLDGLRTDVGSMDTRLALLETLTVRVTAVEAWRGSVTKWATRSAYLVGIVVLAVLPEPVRRFIIELWHG